MDAKTLLEFSGRLSVLADSEIVAANSARSSVVQHKHFSRASALIDAARLALTLIDGDK